MKTNYSDIAKTIDVKNTNSDTSSDLVSSNSDKAEMYASLASNKNNSSINYVKGATESKVAKLNAAKSARSERSATNQIKSSSDIAARKGGSGHFSSKYVKSKYAKPYIGVSTGLKVIGQFDELDGIDKPVDAYNQYKGAKRIYNKIKSRKTPEKAHVNVVDEKKVIRSKSVSTKAAKNQSYKVVAKGASSTAKGAATAGASSAAAGASASAATTTGTVAGGAAAAGTGGGAIAAIGAAAVPIAIVLGIILVMFMFSALIGVIAASDEDRDGYGNLEGVCLEVCQFLREKGVDDVQIAAICGNIWGESGYRPGAIEYDSNGNPLYGHGLCQWSFGRWTQLQNYASVKGKSWTDTRLQLEFLWAELTGEGDAAPYTNRQINWGAFCSIKDVDEATSNFCKQFERPANPVQPKRQAEARRVYAELQSGGNADYGNASEKGKAIANACNTTPSPGYGWCAMWVSNVYQNAGLGRPGGNACDMYWKYCFTNDRSKLEVGMIVAVPTHNVGGSLGYQYGHVGIYVGNGIVKHNAGAIESTPIDRWISTYGQIATVKWGWAS